jgi:hypothetical protein
LNYLWEQLPSGTKVTLSDVKHQRPTFVAPGVGVSGEKLEFKLTVTDTDGFQHKDSVSVNVSNSLLTPIVDAGVDQSVTEGETVTLNGSNSYDPDGTLSSVVWEQVSANNHIDLKPPDELTTQFVAPEVDADGDVLEFKLTVTDDDGLTGEDTVKVTIAPETVSASAGNGNGSGGGGCFIQTAAN